MTLAENLRSKYGLTSLKAGGSCLPLTAINEALETAAQIADRSHAPGIANQIRALKWEAQGEHRPFTFPKFRPREMRPKDDECG
jgi:hypothetical protein